MRAIYEEIKPFTAVRPQDAAAGAINGEAIDRSGYDYGLFIVEAGAASGSPSAQTVDAKLQECATSGGTYTDVTGDTMTQIIADNKQGTIKTNLKGLKTFVRLVVTPGFTGGSTPKVPVSASCVLGPEPVQPV